MTKQERLDRVKVFIEFVNYVGEVNESVEIASFRNIMWASEFIERLAPWNDGLSRYRVQYGDGKVQYI